MLGGMGAMSCMAPHAVPKSNPGGHARILAVALRIPTLSRHRMMRSAVAVFEFNWFWMSPLKRPGRIVRPAYLCSGVSAGR